MDTAAGAIYHQLVVFQNDPSQHELIFNDPSQETQAYIQTLVRGLGLEFEYSTITNSARIIRRSQILAQPAQDEFPEFLDFAQACPSDGELLDVYGFLPSAEVNWNELFSSQDEMDCDSFQKGPMFQSKSAFPELYSFDENQQYLAMSSLDIHPDPTNDIHLTGIQEEQHSLFAFSLDSNVPKIQAQTRRERLIEFQNPQPNVSEDFPAALMSMESREYAPESSEIPSRMTSVQSDIKAILSSLGMSRYLHQFLVQGFDTWEAMSGITESDFDTLGVKLGHRRKLQQLIANQKLTAEVPVGYSSVRPSDEKSTGTSQKDTEFLNFFLTSEGPIPDMSSIMQTMLEGLDENESADIAIMSAANEGQSSSSRQNASRSESLSSCASSTGRSRISKVFSRRESTREETYPGYQVWDSRSANSASSSIGKRCQGCESLLEMQVFQKTSKSLQPFLWLVFPDMCQCGVELPCESCPKGIIKGRNNSAWLQLGCKRGDLEDEMPKIKLCQQIVINKDAVEVAQQVNTGSYSKATGSTYRSANWQHFSLAFRL
jgi:hypothetical protein